MSDALELAEVPQLLEFRAPQIVEDLGFALQAGLLVRHAPAAMSDRFCAARLGDGTGGCAYGTLPSWLDTAAILDRGLAA